MHQCLSFYRVPKNFKLKFVLEPKKLLIKKSIFTVKIPLIAPTLGGPGPPWPPSSYSYGCGAYQFIHGCKIGIMNITNTFF